MKNNSLIALAIFLFIFVSAFFLPDYFLPTDILNNFPGFSINGWERPQNSLLADPVFQFEPWRHYSKERILRGEFPLWNDRNGNGAPFFANPQTAILYPLNGFYYLLSAKTALYLIPFLKLYFFGLFSFLYLRSLRCSGIISLIGSVSAAFAAFPIVWLLWPHTNVYILFPLILFITEKIYQSGITVHRWYIFLSLAYLIAILGGHPETLFHVAVIHLFYLNFRLWKNKKKIIYVMISILMGFVLGSVQLLPFIEYLLNSYVLEKRGLEQMEFYLPLKSFILNAFPFLLGAPHKEYYKPIESYTNFQEAIGGYTGLSVFITAVIGFIFLRKERLVKLWFCIILGSWLIAYKIFPVLLISSLPLLKSSANHRLVGFAAFGIIMVFALTLERIREGKLKIKKNHLNFLKALIVVLLIACTAVFIIPHFYVSSSEKIKNFLFFLRNHIAWIIVTTVLYLLLIKKFIQKEIFASKILLLLIPILMQSLFIFWNYNPVNSTGYYPANNVIKKLETLPRGPVLEVGNPAFAANVNLIYQGLYQVQNDDAMEIADYRKAFDKFFPAKNQWKNVDDISVSSAQEFSIKYIISDYDLNLLRKKIQPQYERVLNPIVSSSMKISFKGENKFLKEIRILTANFNRKNNCNLNVEIRKKHGQEELYKTLLSCRDIRDFMYYTISTPPLFLSQGAEYEVAIGSSDSIINNSVALWGNNAEKPYLELLYEKSLDKNNELFQLISKEKNIYLWEVPAVSDITVSEGNYSIISKRPEELRVEINIKDKESIQIKQPFYPGWSAFVDGKKTEIQNTNPFILVKIPKGKHILELKYQPVSFYAGILLTLTGFLILFIYLLRKERQEKWWKDFSGNWDRWARATRSSVKWWEHSLIILLGISISAVIYIFLTNSLSIRFDMPLTSAVNWYTVSQYPRQQDYFYFFSGLLFAFIFTTLFWAIWIWKKSKIYFS